MSNLNKGDANRIIAVAAASAVVSAAVTYAVAKSRTDRERRRVLYQNYQQDQERKKETARQRGHSSGDDAAAPETGTFLEGVGFDRVYLWECEDLRRRFSSANVENLMMCKVVPRRSLLLPGKAPTFDHHEPCKYNKLIGDRDCILGDVVRKPGNAKTWTVAYQRAGPRKLLHFHPAKVNAAIVTCGGLCPGLNNVIRGIVQQLYQMYGISGKVYGIQGGYRGFYGYESGDSSSSGHLPPIELTHDLVEGIHHEGGTILKSSRGGFDLDKILDFLQDKKINQLYVIGGDGTHRGAFRIHEGCMERGMNVAVAGIPKTIDNDVDYVDHSFGFNSAVEAAQLAIRSAKTEAVCNLPNGIGIVKLMGRSAGFIAAHATMSSSDVDLCLVPEVPTVLEGPDGCLPHLMRRVEQQGYAVVVVAEGAGEDVLGVSAETDASGNKKLPAIGEFMKNAVTDYFAKNGKVATVKYIDPSYTVRSVPANAADSLYCMQLAQNVVHGAMAGYTGFSVGLSNNRMVFLPIPELVRTSPRSMDPRGRTWERVLALTRQPNTVPKLKPGEEDRYDSHAPTLR